MLHFFFDNSNSRAKRHGIADAAACGRKSRDFYSIFTRLFIIIDTHSSERARPGSEVGGNKQQSEMAGTCLISLNGNLNVNVTPVECHFHILKHARTAAVVRG